MKELGDILQKMMDSANKGSSTIKIDLAHNGLTEDYHNFNRMYRKLENS
jgi:hypothetical protein